MRAIAQGASELNSIVASSSLSKSGLISEYLKDLELAGFIIRDYTWSLKNGGFSKLSKFRLSDNYIRFYLKYIEKHQGKLRTQAIEIESLPALPGWGAVMGLQMENLVLNNRPMVHKALHINPNEIIMTNPYFQRKTKVTPGCQVDYMIQTQYNTLYLCEIRASKNPIGSEVIHEVQDKIQRLKRPKYFTLRPVLLHTNGVTDQLRDSQFFSNIIDIKDFLQD